MQESSGPITLSSPNTAQPGPAQPAYSLVRDGTDPVALKLTEFRPSLAGLAPAVASAYTSMRDFSDSFSQAIAVLAESEAFQLFQRAASSNYTTVLKNGAYVLKREGDGFASMREVMVNAEAKQSNDQQLAQMRRERGRVDQPRAERPRLRAGKIVTPDTQAKANAEAKARADAHRLKLRRRFESLEL